MFMLVNINSSPSNIFLTMLLPEKFHKNCSAVFGKSNPLID